MELSDLRAARAEAIRRIRAILKAEAATGLGSMDRRIEIKDEAGVVLMVVPFTSAIV
jgi:hypothetical protein